MLIAIYSIMIFIDISKYQIFAEVKVFFSPENDKWWFRIFFGAWLGSMKMNNLKDITLFGANIYNFHILSNLALF